LAGTATKPARPRRRRKPPPSSVPRSPRRRYVTSPNDKDLKTPRRGYRATAVKRSRPGAVNGRDKRDRYT